MFYILFSSAYSADKRPNDRFTCCTFKRIHSSLWPFFPSSHSSYIPHIIPYVSDFPGVHPERYSGMPLELRQPAFGTVLNIFHSCVTISVFFVFFVWFRCGGNFQIVWWDIPGVSIYGTMRWGSGSTSRSGPTRCRWC